MSVKHYASRLALIALLASCSRAPHAAPPRPEPAEFLPGQPWLDSAGEPIEAHAGGILELGDTWYWYGENHRLGSGNRTGISVYSSRDLEHWQNEGVALPKDSLPELFRDRGVAERPKVIYNARTKQYVMWLHLDANRYAEASAGVAVADSPTGPFRVVRIFRPIAYDYGYSPEEAQLQERTRGNSFRDMGLFQDDDGSAYVIYAAESNVTLYVVRLSDDYTDIVRPAVEGKTWARIIPNGRREAPSPFKYRGKYYLITSGLTGWRPNPAQYHVADHMLGPWATRGNPVIGPEAATTFRSQSTFVLPLPSVCEACFIFMADRWDSQALQRSSYIWLPFVIAPDGTIRIEPRERWDLAVFETLQREAEARTSPPEQVRLVPVGEGWARSSVNAAIFRSNSIITHDSAQYAAWYDGEGRMVLAKRRVGSEQWEVRPTRYTGNVRDAHNAISSAVDGSGVLHVAWDHHGQPLNYARAVAPGSLELTDRLALTGAREDEVTYPQFFVLRDGGLALLYRAGRSGGGDVLLNHYDPGTASWRAVQHPLIAGEGARNAYVNPLAVDARGGWHLSWVWRETPDVATNHDLMYAFSPDQGRSWFTSAGERYALPITAANAEVVWRVAQGSGLINQTSMAVGADGRPVIATYWRPEGSNVPQYQLVWFTGHEWRSSRIGQRDVAFRLEGTGTRRIPMSRPLVLTGAENAVYVVFRDEEQGGGITVACAADTGRTDWRFMQLETGSVGLWEPTHDPVAWTRDRQLHLFHQVVGQGQGETLEDVPPQPVSVLEWSPRCGRLAPVTPVASAQVQSVFPADSVIRALLAARVGAGGTAGIAIGLLEPDGSVRFLAAGDPGPGRTLDRRSVFEIGSITKAFTGVLLADMARRGEMALDDPVAKYLPAGLTVPARNGRQITLAQLSAHTSGLPRLPTNLRIANFGNPYADYTVEQLYAFLGGYALTRDPGETYEYSNLGGGLLGHALALRAGKSYEALVRERILEPLGMAHTGVTLTPWMRERMVAGHNALGDTVSLWDLPTLAGAGALRSNVEDMLKFVAAGLGGSGGLRESFERAMRPRARAGSPRLSVGLGWHRLELAADTIVWHNGGTGGFRTFIGLVPGAGKGIVLLSNTGTTGHDDLALHLLNPELPLAAPPRR